ncbi:TIGR04283 family arsenosugar biosynthesis glycosyltransferase [Roseobacter sp. N2S]|uniref:TIGR04283 family arsenosugar biosynthesis glycosyltransferase n=1 Tax=Roseobacter sp. N2S TaxID=2663844 RepID=UPI0028666ED6|nr:TIGR04283 family arsenosugar biosynthesis glycosyltransferase [Roseobacter sp. N2S]MDR6264920.1 hypothetical protein [Roseobacter sp. N2S]
MPAPLTVILPTLNCADQLGPTVASLYLGVEAGLIHQVIFADGGSTDGIERVADDIGAELVVSPQGRGTQLAAAAKTAKTGWLLFVHADTVLSADWPKILRHHIETSQNAAYFQLRFDAKSTAPRLVAAWANLRARLFALPYGDQGLLIKTSHYTKIGGYPEIPLMEDVAIARKLRRNLTALPATATTSAARYTSEGWMKRGTRNLTTLALYFLGTPPEKLAQRYTKR